MFLFSIICKYFLISLVIYHLTHWLFKKVLFSFYIFVNRPVFILLLISSYYIVFVEINFEIFLFLPLLKQVLLNIRLSRRMEHVPLRKIFCCCWVTCSLLLGFPLAYCGMLHGIYHGYPSSSFFFILLSSVPQTGYLQLTCLQVCWYFSFVCQNLLLKFYNEFFIIIIILWFQNFCCVTLCNIYPFVDIFYLFKYRPTDFLSYLHMASCSSLNMLKTIDFKLLFSKSNVCFLKDCFC